MNGVLISGEVAILVCLFNVNYRFWRVLIQIKISVLHALSTLYYRVLQFFFLSAVFLCSFNYIYYHIDSFGQLGLA